MSAEILSILEYMEKEKGITRDEMISIISTAIKNAAAKGVNAGQEIKVEINPRNGHLQAWSLLKVVDSMSDPKSEINLEKARLLKPDAQLGDFVEREIDPSYLGRIAAQAARQGIMQRLRQFEKERIYDHFKDQVGDVVSGIVRRRERGDLIVELGTAEALLPHRERVPGEDYSPGERIRCLLLKIDNSNRGPELILSRAHPKFVRRLFELEVTEIADGTVVLRALAREAGYRTKIAVISNDSKVDPVGACVGARGARVKSIVRELGGEKIDIVRYSDDPVEFLTETLRPAVPKNINLDRRSKKISFEVSEDDLAVAIGRKGQNARLTSRLLGWKLDIHKERTQKLDFEDKKKMAADAINQIPGLEGDLATRLVAVGFVSPETFSGVEPDDLVEAGFSAEEAAFVLERVQEFFAQQNAQP
ncbi:MAG: transcription termination factor NusA [Opitutales bacterium]|nr:transcription termination factor NusA [Opitutales bacterium]